MRKRKVEERAEVLRRGKVEGKREMREERRKREKGIKTARRCAPQARC